MQERPDYDEAATQTPAWDILLDWNALARISYDLQSWSDLRAKIGEELNYGSHERLLLTRQGLVNYVWEGSYVAISHVWAQAPEHMPGLRERPLKLSTYKMSAASGSIQ